MKFVFPVALSAPRPYRGLARIVSLRPYRLRRGLLFRDLRKQIPVPFGWMIRRDDGPFGARDAVLTAPWWVMIFVWLRRDCWWRVCERAVRHGWAKEPYEGCYLNELVWFPRLRKRSRAT